MRSTVVQLRAAASRLLYRRHKVLGYQVRCPQANQPRSSSNAAPVLSYLQYIAIPPYSSAPAQNSDPRRALFAAPPSLPATPAPADKAAPVNNATVEPVDSDCRSYPEYREPR